MLNYNKVEKVCEQHFLRLKQNQAKNYTHNKKLNPY